MFKISKVDWTQVITIDGREHIIKLPFEGWISVWTDNYLKHIGPREPHQIQILLGSRIKL